MCNFFSCNSNGEGKVLFFKLEDVAKIMAEGNPKSYEFNSHTSIAHYHGVCGLSEDGWNKWEYDVDKKVLNVDTLNTKDDRKAVLKEIEKYLGGKDVGFIRNLYNWNSGNWNSGDWNSGNWNSGDWNSGNRNSGDRNSGNWNSGNRNSGNRNSGDWNSGNRNSGDWNSGNWNSGNWNSGNWNSGNGIRNSLCTKTLYMLFNKPCSEKQYREANNLIWDLDIKPCRWINDCNMTEEEKEQNPQYKTIGGYLKKIDSKEGWKVVLEKADKETIKRIKKLKNYTPKVFKELTGCKI